MTTGPNIGSYVIITSRTFTGDRNGLTGQSNHRRLWRNASSLVRDGRGRRQLSGRRLSRANRRGSWPGSAPILFLPFRDPDLMGEIFLHGLAVVLSFLGNSFAAKAHTEPEARPADDENHYEFAQCLHEYSYGVNPETYDFMVSQATDSFQDISRISRCAA